MEHAPSLILEYSCHVCSPVAPGLTSPRALRSRVLQASKYFQSHLRVLPWSLRGCEVLMPQVVLSLLLYGVR
jgi:hypothetical protein